MDRVFIQANCQGRPIKRIFETVPRLKQRYQFLPIKPVHLWKPDDKDKVIEYLQEADIFMHQPVFGKNFGFYASENLKKIP